MLVGLALMTTVYVAVLIVLCSREGVGNVFAAPSTVRRGLARAWIPFGIAYLVLVALFFMAALTSQRLTSHVRVEPGFPAQAAGLRDGDRVVALEGVPVEFFEQLAQRPFGAGRLTVEVVRGSERLTLGITPDPNGRIGLRPTGESVAPGAGAALATAWR